MTLSSQEIIAYPTKAAQAVSSVYGFAPPIDLTGCVRVWWCPCARPGEPLKITICRMCGGRKRIYTTPGDPYHYTQ